jgi:hypothetical protein
MSATMTPSSSPKTVQVTLCLPLGQCCAVSGVSTNRLPASPLEDGWPRLVGCHRLPGDAHPSALRWPRDGVAQFLTTVPTWPDADAELHTVSQVILHMRPHLLAYHQLLAGVGRGEITVESEGLRTPRAVRFG